MTVTIAVGHHQQHPYMLQSLPVLPLKDTVVYPQIVVPLAVGRTRSMAAVEAAMQEGRQFVAVAQKAPDVDEPLLAERIGAAIEAVREDPGSGETWGRLGEVYDVNAFEERALAAYARALPLLQEALLRSDRPPPISFHALAHAAGRISPVCSCAPAIRPPRWTSCPARPG